MNVVSLPQWLSRCWPRKVRTRLTVLYATLFFVAGSVLLGLTYGLVAGSLRTESPQKISPENARILQTCNESPPQQFDPSFKEQCAKAYAIGAQAGSQSQREQALDNLLLFSLLGLVVMTLLSGGLGWIVSGRVLRPVRAITETAKRASEQHLGERLALAGPKDELKELADTFDDMLERLDSAFASQKRFVANASHELRTPLTVMRTAIDVTLAKQSRTPEQLEAMAVKVRRSIDRAEEMIDGLLTLAVSDRGRSGHEQVDLATATDDALDTAAAAIKELGLRVDVALEAAETDGDKFLLDRMIANLVDNAARHNHPDGWISVRTGVNNESALFEVANSGPFVPEDAIRSLFEPFGRAEARVNPQKGAGLGLSIVDSIANAHNATVDVRSQPEGGLKVRILLPAHSASALEEIHPVGSPNL